MTTPPSPKGSAADWLVDRALRGLIGTALRLPYARRVPFMGAALRRAIGPIAGYRRRAEANLAMIYPDMPVDVRRQTADGVCDNFGRTLIENYSWAEFGHRLAATTPTGDGLGAVAQAKADGRPVIFVTGHFGNHEAPRHILTRMGYNIGGLYRPMTNAYFNAHYAPTMTAWGGPVFEQGRRGTMGFARHLKSGGMGTLLFDVANKKGLPITFMGKPANTATSAADLAIKLDALVVPYFGTRRADGLTFDVDVQSPIAHAAPAQMMQTMTDRLTDKVTDHPDQWFWVHRRWKNAP
ncbi:MAG: lysophospholipid acyltransferase family protein [Yoonia sp.]|nr:lysophospholipid acyltransferase family protein [Yoonia sp.]